MDPPPCLKPGEALNACARAVYAFEVNSTADLSGEWAGWRLRGRVLISPDGDRISPARLRGLLFVEAGRRRAPTKTAQVHTLKSGLHGDETSRI